MMNGDDGQKTSNGDEFGNMGECLFLVDTFMLGKALSNKAIFITFDGTIIIVLDFINPFATNDTMTRRKVSESPYVVLFQGKEFGVHGSLPLRITISLLKSGRFNKCGNSTSKGSMGRGKMNIRNIVI